MVDGDVEVGVAPAPAPGGAGRNLPVAPSHATALERLDELVGRHCFDGGLTQENMEVLIWQLACPRSEKEDMVHVLHEAAGRASGTLTVKTWNEFCLEFEDKVMREGHVNSCWHRVLDWVDLFQVSTWHDFAKYSQATWLGAVASLTAGLTFLVIMITSLIAFVTDANLSVRQQFTPNHYGPATITRFFFFFRTAYWENKLDPSLFTFQMSYYFKHVNETSGSIIEEYVPVPSRVITSTDVSWWPKSIAPDIIAVAPQAANIEIQGAYYMTYFQQLEVKLIACRNSTDPSKPVCRSPEEIHEALHGGSVNLVDYSVDFHETVPKSVYWTLMADQTKQVDLWYNRRTIAVTGKQPLASDQVTEVSPFFGSTEQVAPGWGDGTMAVFWFSQGNELMRETHLRESIVDVLGDVGGSWASLLSVFGIAAYSWNRWRLSRNLEKLRERSRLVEDLRIITSSNRHRLRRQLRAVV